MQTIDNLPRIDNLVWDSWNLEHIIKDSVTVEEAEEVIAGYSIFRASYKRRLLVTGPTAVGRMLTIVVGEVPLQPSTYYVFAARPASREERREFREWRGGIER